MGYASQDCFETLRPSLDQFVNGWETPSYRSHIPFTPASRALDSYSKVLGIA